MQSTNGTIYGLTEKGANPGCVADGGCGTIYSLSGFAPFVEALPNFGAIGRVVDILGNNLTGTSQVFFNDAPAIFKVISSTLIRAQVPSGVATAVINVVTPGGVLSSNGPFQVLP